MKPIKKNYTLVLATLFTCGILNNAHADRYNNNFDVKYDQVISHSYDLESVAAELKAHFKDQFRSSRLFGKLVAKANRIKNRSRSLHRHGVSRGTCNWHDEIRQLDDLTCGIRELVNEAVRRSRYGADRPLCGNAVRTTYKLLGKADWHVKGLKRALYQVSRPAYSTPNLSTGNGFGVYRGPNDFLTRHNQNRNNVYTTFNNRPQANCGTRPRNSGLSSRNGTSLNVAGYKFYLNR